MDLISLYFHPNKIKKKREKENKKNRIFVFFRFMRCQTGTKRNFEMHGWICMPCSLVGFLVRLDLSIFGNGIMIENRNYFLVKLRQFLGFNM